MPTFRLIPLLLAAALSLPADGLAAPPQPQVGVAGYVPSQHGFHFPNSFTGSPLPKPLAALAGKAAPSRFGLCGGMSSASADFFLAKRPIAGTSKVPSAGTPLYDYIYARQVDSFGDSFNMVTRFARWMAAPDSGFAGTRHATAAALPEILAPLDQGRPALVGMVLVRAGRGVLWNNHQVLAFGYSRLPGHTLRLHIYDPNHPRNDRVALDLSPALCGTLFASSPAAPPLPIIGFACTQRIGADDAPEHDKTAPVRGIFLMPFDPRTPPASLTD